MATDPFWSDSGRVLEAFFESGSVGFSFVDLEGRFVGVNGALCRLLGYTEQQLLSMTFSQITHTDDRQPSQEILGRGLRGDYRTSSFEKRYLRADGEIVWVQVTPTLLSDDEGRPTGYATLTLDITERKRTEEAERGALPDLRQLGPRRGARHRR